jgi:hypothetical protein
MTMKNISLSIVIPFKNESVSLRNIVETHESLFREEIEIIFVNDLSSDDSEEILLRNLPKANVVKGKGDGVAAAFYEGARTALGEYILLLPVDCHVGQTTVLCLLSLIHKKQSSIFFMPKQYSHNSSMSLYAKVQNLILLKFFKLASWTNGFLFHRIHLSLFEKVRNYSFLGDLEFSKILRKENWFILDSPIIVSPRRYYQDGEKRRIVINGFILVCWFFRIMSIESLRKIYLRIK